MTAVGSATLAPQKSKRAGRPPAEFEIIDVLRSLQRRNKTKPRVPKRGDRIGFSFSTMDRYLFTLQSLQSLDTESGFDLIWNDGSKERGVPALSRNYKFQNANLV